MKNNLSNIRNKILDSHLVYLILILSISLAVNLININKFFPVTDGWFQHYAALILDGQIIYKDFHIFIPPGFVFLITALQGIFGTYYIIFRIYGLLERLLLITLAYYILKRFFKPKTIFITLSAAAAISITNVQDLLYGYYQTCLLLAVVCLFFMLKLYDNYDNTHKRILYAIILGISCGISIMFKQTMGVFVPFVLLAVSMLTMVRKDKKKYFITLSYILGGFLISILPVIIYLAVNQAFVPFIEQVFLNSSSKGSIFNVFFAFIIREFTVRYGYSIFAVSFFTIAIIVLSLFRDFKGKKRLILGLRYAAIFLFFFMLFEPLITPRPSFAFFASFATPAEKTAAFFLFASIAVVAIISFFVIRTKLHKKPFFHQILSLSLFLVVVGCLIFISLNPTLIVRYDSLNRLCFVFFLILIILCIHHLRLAIKTKDDNSVKFLFACGVALAIMYTHGMSGTLEPHCLLLPLTLVVGLILENDLFNIKNKQFFLNLPHKEVIVNEDVIADGQSDASVTNPNKNACRKLLRASKAVSLSQIVKNIMIGFVCMLYIVSAGQQKAYITYHWWGLNALPSIYDAKYKADDKSLSGFTLPESTVNMLNSIKKTVDLNKKDGDTMYTFSHINYFNVMSGMDSTTFAKVHYFDVCPDDLAIADAKRLIENKNSFIIWQDFTDYEWQFHEDYFRSGNPSGQRKIKEAINILFTDGSYIFAGEFKDRESNPIQVWVINDGRPIYNFMGERII